MARPVKPAAARVQDVLSRKAALEDAYATYDAAISERWRTGPGQRPPKQAEPPQTFENPEAACAAAHAQYHRDIEERWRDDRLPSLPPCRRRSRTHR